jgi:hypothetical protein
MAFNKPTHITKITYSVKKTGKQFETSLGSTFATKFVGSNGASSDKFSGKTFLTVTIDGQQFLVPVSLSAKPTKTEKGDAIIIHVNQTDTIDFVSEREVAIADLAKPAAPAAAAPAPVASLPRGTGGAIVRTPSTGSVKMRTL